MLYPKSLLEKIEDLIIDSIMNAICWLTAMILYIRYLPGCIRVYRFERTSDYTDCMRPMLEEFITTGGVEDMHEKSMNDIESRMISEEQKTEDAQENSLFKGKEGMALGLLLAGLNSDESTMNDICDFIKESKLVDRYE